MEYNHYNSQLNQVPPYPQGNFDFRNMPPSATPVVSSSTAKNILDYKDSPESFVNSVLRTAIGKEARFYFSYPDSIKWRDMMYEGKLEVVGEDYIVVREKSTKHLHVLLMLYLEYVVFEEE